ncbi:MarR family transcriptional regulator [Candidatus Parcubacteria bacterium]|nr:MarR family transcriptional regulator [Candidatus Parcubacteria bacterium]
MGTILKKIKDTIQNRKSYRAGLLQARVYRVLKGYSQDKLMSGYGLSTIDWALLGLLHDNVNGLRPSVLAEALGVEPPFVTVLVSKLKKLGLIDVKTRKDDSRVKIFFLNEKGNKLVPEVEKYLREEMKVLVHGINPKDLMTYLSVLEQIVENSKGLKFKKFTGFRD